jgi:heme oxygenase
MTKQQMIDQLRAAHNRIEKLINDSQVDIDRDYFEMHLRQITDVITALEAKV